MFHNWHKTASSLSLRFLSFLCTRSTQSAFFCLLKRVVPAASHSTLPYVAAAHVEQPNQAVELDVQAPDLPPALALGCPNDGEATARLVGCAEGGVPVQGDGFARDGVDAINLKREGRVRELLAGNVSHISSPNLGVGQPARLQHIGSSKI